MKRAPAMLLLGLLLVGVFPTVTECAAEPPAELPDLWAAALVFWFDGHRVELVEAFAPYLTPLTVTIYIGNLGPGVSTGANVSVFEDGRLLARFPVGATVNVTGHGNLTWPSYMWNVSALGPGWHVFRAEVSDPAGDMNLSDNSIERRLHFLEKRPELDITLSPRTLVANITSTDPATVEFSGVVRAGTVDDLVPTIELSSSIDVGWAVSMIEGPEFGTDAPIKTFRARVTVPRGTFADVSGHLQVSGVLLIGGLSNLAEATATVTVRPYFCASVECERPHQTIGPGDRETFEYFITNTGNYYDSYTLSIDNQKELEAKGWSLTLTRTKLTRMIPGNRALVRVVVVPPADWSVHRDEVTAIRLNVTSLNGTGASVVYSDDLPATVRVRGYNTPGVALLSASLVILAAIASAALYIRRRRRRRR